MYSQSITRTHRTAFVFLIDGSGSMSEQITYNAVTRSKAEVVDEITNHLLFELIERARREEGVRDYYDIAVMSYSGDDRISSLLPDGREMMSVEELSHCEPMMNSRTIECRMPDIFNTPIREVKGMWSLPPFRGMSFNASPVNLLTMLNIGSISVKTE